MNLLLTLPFCAKDATLLLRCLEWMEQLQPDGYKHCCLMVEDSETPAGVAEQIRHLAKRLFRNAIMMTVNVPPDFQGWPLAPNFMFAAAARQIQECYRMPWLWFEPDAVPLKPLWLDRIAQAYEECPKRFMGSHIPSNSQPDMPPLHLAGCAVYDTHAYTGLQMFTGGKVAFDIASAAYSIHRSVNCQFMQHFWGQTNLAPTFVLSRTPDSPKNAFAIDQLWTQAVMFHRCKDGSLIDCLRQKANSRKVKAKSVPAQISEAMAP